VRVHCRPYHLARGGTVDGNGDWVWSSVTLIEFDSANVAREWAAPPPHSLAAERVAPWHAMRRRATSSSRMVILEVGLFPNCLLIVHPYTAAAAAAAALRVAAAQRLTQRPQTVCSRVARRVRRMRRACTGTPTHDERAIKTRSVRPDMQSGFAESPEEGFTGEEEDDGGSVKGDAISLSDSDLDHAGGLL